MPVLRGSAYIRQLDYFLLLLRMIRDDKWCRYCPVDFTVEWCLPFRLQVVCFRTRRIVSDSYLNSALEVKKAIDLLEPQSLQYDFITICSKGAGWLEARLQLDEKGKMRMRQWLDIVPGQRSRATASD